jgi:copper(I)-binding protein
MHIRLHEVKTLKLASIEVHDMSQPNPFFTRVIVVETKDGEKVNLTLFAETAEDLYLKD